MIKIDGIILDSAISIGRNIALNDLYRVQTADGKFHREISNKKVNFPITFSPKTQADYDTLFEKLTETVPYHTIEIPWTSNSTKTFEIMITNVSDTVAKSINGENMFTGLTVVFDER